MSKSKLPIPAKHKDTATLMAKKTNQPKVYITEDGHFYVPANKPLLDFHCQQNGKTYWELEVELDAPAAAAPVVETKAAETKVETKENATTEELSDADKKKIAESASAAGAPDPATIEKLKGLTVDKLSAMTKDVLKGYAADLKIDVSDEDTKPVIAEAIMKVVNA